METVQVLLGERSYPIHIGPGLIDDGDLVRECIPAPQVMIVTNEIVAPLYLNRLERSLAAEQQHSLVLPDGEEQKNLATLGAIIDRLVAEGFRRDACLVALGGGVIGDITGFAAACYQRGIAFAQVPTTLLAQVDSSVGGKTAVNHPKAKNMIGAFHQPIAVLVDTGTLASLPEREFSAGLAEVIKHGLILDESFLLWLEEKMEAILDHDFDALARIVRRSCEIKAAIVAEDELEQGRRALLNLGHTFGHALESLGAYKDWLHGEAVAVGIALAAWTSKEMGMIDADDCRRVESVLSRAGLPVTTGPEIDADAMLRIMRLDKKAGAMGLRLIVLERLGSAVVSPAPGAALLRRVIRTRAVAHDSGTPASRARDKRRASDTDRAPPASRAASTDRTVETDRTKSVNRVTAANPAPNTGGTADRDSVLTASRATAANPAAPHRRR